MTRDGLRAQFLRLDMDAKGRGDRVIDLTLYLATEKKNVFVSSKLLLGIT